MSIRNAGLMFNVADPFVADLDELDYRDGYCAWCDDGPCTCNLDPIVTYRDDRRNNVRLALEAHERVLERADKIVPLTPEEKEYARFIENSARLFRLSRPYDSLLED